MSISFGNPPGYRELSNVERLKILRQEARRISGSQAMYEILTGIKKKYPTKKFGRNFWVDLSHFIVFKSSAIFEPLLTELTSACCDYKFVAKEYKFKYIRKYAKIVRKDKSYPDSNIERVILISRRNKKQKFGEYFWSDLAYYLYN